MFEIRTDVASRRLTARLSGQWDTATATRYLAAVRDAAAQLGPSRSYWLIDAGGFPVQSGLVAEQIEAGLREVGSDRHDVIAFVNGSALMAMQARRVAPRSGHRHFTSADEAQRWLEEQRSGG